jgi:CBS domain containing-hemolysin-like protein
MSELMTKGLTHGPSLKGFNRFELAAMAELSAREGQIAQQESDILKNLLLMRETKVQDAMTPGTVIFSIDENLLLDEFFEHHEQSRFSRIPIYHKHKSYN